MKYTLLLLCAFLLLQSPAYAGEVIGNGKVTIEKRIVNADNEIHITGPFSVVASDDPNGELLQIETDQNLQRSVIVETINSIIYVTIKAGTEIKTFTKMNVYIHNLNMHAIVLRSDNPETSVITMDGGCEHKHVTIEGSNPAFITLMGATLIANINDESTVYIGGNLYDALIEKKGSGMLAAYDLKTGNMKLKDLGIGATEVYANVSLMVHNDSAGNIYYKGTATSLDIKETGTGVSCREGYGDTIKGDIVAETPKSQNLKHHITDGIDVDSLFADMMERDQKPRRIKAGEIIQAKAADNENFRILKWFLDKYGYPEIGTDSTRAMFPTLFVHIDDYGHFMQIKDHLLKAVKDGKLPPNEYAYAYDRSMTSSSRVPYYYYLMPGSPLQMKYKPSGKEKKEVDQRRKEIGLPAYPLLFNGNYM